MVTERKMNAMGISFHYFHNNREHIECQGSFDEKQFDEMIQKIISRYDVLSPESFLEVVNSGINEGCTKVVITFSCGLKSQYDIALPILKKYGIKAIWFLYTDNFYGNDILVEKYHHFRFYSYKNIDLFYDDFFKCAKEYVSEKDWDDYNSVDEYAWSDYYTEQDKKYKYLRNKILSKEIFNSIMNELMRKKGYCFDDHKQEIWLTKDMVREIVSQGHMLGLHTHTHPNDVKSLSYEMQKKEYLENKKCLESIIGKEVSLMSHPCNSYNDDTLKVLHELRIKYGFRADMSKQNYSLFELPQIDASSLYRILLSEGRT